jgi:hypothetical protein
MFPSKVRLDTLVIGLTIDPYTFIQASLKRVNISDPYIYRHTLPFMTKTDKYDATDIKLTKSFT